MKLTAEFIAIILISFCFTVGGAYLWGYASHKADHPCYVRSDE